MRKDKDRVTSRSLYAALDLNWATFASRVNESFLCRATHLFEEEEYVRADNTPLNLGNISDTSDGIQHCIRRLMSVLTLDDREKTISLTDQAFSKVHRATTPMALI
jgi:hypothetical protein